MVRVIWCDMAPITASDAFGRLRASVRQRRWIPDLGLAVLVLALGILSTPSISVSTVEQTLYSLVVVGTSIALVFLRTAPRVSLAAIGALLIAHVFVVGELTVFAGAACLIAAYTIQTQLASPWRWGYTLVVYLGVGLAAVNSMTPVGTRWDARLEVLGVVLLAVTVAVLAGIVRRGRAQRYEAALERAAFLEASRDTELRLAAVEERSRVARDMHDILGHSLNAIAIQAEGARYVLRTSPEQADTALADIGSLSRAAVDEVRDLIDVLHTDDETASRHPTPSLADVPELIASFRNARIRLTASGDVSDVTSHVALSGYRIVQEALTNAAKHAPGAAVIVRIAVTQQAVDLTIANGPSPNPGPATPSGSHGLVGMRERARTLGGTVQAGPDTATGGWKVVARLPRSRA